MQHSYEQRCGKMRLRPLRESDLPLTRAWRNASRQAFGSTAEVDEATHQEFFDRYLVDPDAITFVGEVDGEPVAHVSLYAIDRDTGSAEFGRLMVARPGDGLGRLATWGALLAAFQQLDLRQLYLDVREDNGAARRLYEESGFIAIPSANCDPAFVRMRLRRQERYWDHWDQPCVVDEIEGAWRQTGEQQHRAHLAAMVRPQLGGQVLEVGCGTGLVIQALRAAGWAGSYVGADTSYTMLGKALTTLPHERFRFGDLFALPFEDGAFETVVCFEVLGHLPRIDLPLLELMRVTRQRLIFSMWTTAHEDDQVGSEVVQGHRFLHVNRPVSAAVRPLHPGVNINTRMLGSSAVLMTIDKPKAP